MVPYLITIDSKIHFCLYTGGYSCLLRDDSEHFDIELLLAGCTAILYTTQVLPSLPKIAKHFLVKMGWLLKITGSVIRSIQADCPYYHKHCRSQ